MIKVKENCLFDSKGWHAESCNLRGSKETRTTFVNTIVVVNVVLVTVINMINSNMIRLTWFIAKTLHCIA